MVSLIVDVSLLLLDMVVNMLMFMCIGISLFGEIRFVLISVLRIVFKFVSFVDVLLIILGKLL